MASTADIKHSIKSITETEKITRAMYLISTSKMKKAINRYEANRVYFERVQSAMKDILLHSQGIEHPYIGESSGARAAYIVIAADKGLCGGYNHNVLNLAFDYIKKSEEKHILTVGQEARAFFARRKYVVDVEFLHVSQNPSLNNARNIATDIIGLYEKGIMDEVNVVYTRFISALKQEAKVLKLLPLSMANLIEIETETKYATELKYHPSPKEVFDVLVPQYVIGLLYGCLVQSYASEHCARMTAMESATDNAEEMIKKLTMDYNRARQQAITREISEIMGAIEALS